MRRRQLTLMALLIGMLGLVLMLTGAQAQDDEHYLGYRQKVMESMGASMGAIGDILKHKLPFAGHIGVHASDISRMSAAIALAFEREITEGRTDAKPEVWQDWDKFVTAAETLPGRRRQAGRYRLHRRHGSHRRAGEEPRQSLR